MIVNERTDVVEYIKEHGLTKQYLKVKKYLEKDMFNKVSLKKREPKKYQVYYFRINKKYRALGHFVEKVFIVTEILDHQ